MTTLVPCLRFAKHTALIAISTSALLLSAAACTPDGPDPAAGTDRIDILVSATATDPTPTLGAPSRSLLVGRAKNAVAKDGTDGTGASARVLSAAGDYSSSFPLTPRRQDGSVEHGLNRDRLINQNIDEVAAAVAGIHADEPGLDLLAAIDDATRGAAPATLLVLSHGLSTRGGLDLRQVGWSADPRAVAGRLSDDRLLPALTGWRVIFTGLGSTAGDQPPLSRPTRLKLTAYWMAICTRAGGRCETDDAPAESTEPASTTDMPVVAVPGVTSVVGPSGRTTYAVSDSVLGFQGNSAVVSPEGVKYLAAVVAQIERSPGAKVTVTGFCADPPGSTPAGLLKLSRQRAESVAGILGGPVTVVGGGVAPGPSAVRNGHFDEARAARMRRVEITF